MEIDLSGLLETYGPLSLEYSLDIVGALLLLIGGWIAAGWVRRALRRSLQRLPQIDPTMVGALSNISRYLVLILVLVAVLAQFGVQTASILAVLGTIGLAIGLAMQGTLANVAAGFMLLFLRPFKIGDYIDAEGVQGTIREVGLFTTEFMTYDGVYQSVPNSMLWNRSILNYSRHPTRRLDLPVQISYGDSVEGAMAALLRLMQGHEQVLKEPEPVVLVRELGDNGITLNLRCWCDADLCWTFQFELTKLAKDCLEAEGYSIPFPQRDIHMIEAA